MSGRSALRFLAVLSVAGVLASGCVSARELVGLPECQLTLAQAVTYLACAPKSNAAASAIWQATADIKEQPTVRVPKHLKDSHYPAAKKAGFGVDYKYPHDYEGGFVSQEYLPAAARKEYYRPTGRGYEKNMKQYLQELQTLIKKSVPLEDGPVEKDR